MTNQPAQTTPTSKKARIGVVGTGWWSTTAHIPALKRNPNAELVALCDRSPEALAKADKAYGPFATYTDCAEMLAKEKLDGVIVATNHNSHYALTKLCLEAGQNVLLEKPMVLKATHAHELVDLAKRQGVELIVGYPYHFTSLTRRARDVIQSGELGGIQLVTAIMASMVIEFYRGNDQAYQPTFGYAVTGPGRVYSDPVLSGGGQGHLQVTHLAGALFFITGLQAETVSAYMEKADVAVDLVDAISLRFAAVNGHHPIGTIASTGNVATGEDERFDIGIHCEKGSLLLEHSRGTLLVQRHGSPKEQFGLQAGEERYPQMDTSANLVDVILGRAPNGSPGTVGMRVVEMLDAAYHSADGGGVPVRVADLL